MRNPTKYTLQETIGWEEFEDICCSFLYVKGYKEIKKAGKVKDQGRDAVTLINKKAHQIFQFSKEKEPLKNKRSKFWKEYNKWKDEKDINDFIFISSQDLGAEKIKLETTLINPNSTIFDITNLVNFLDYDSDGKEIKKNYAIFTKDLEEIFGATDRLNTLSRVADVINNDENYNVVTILSEREGYKADGFVFSIASEKATQFFTPKSKDHYEKAIPSGSFKLAIPKDEEGTAFFEKYKAAMESGEAITIPPQYVTRAEFRLGDKLLFDGGGKQVSITFDAALRKEPVILILKSKKNKELFRFRLVFKNYINGALEMDNYNENSPLDIKLVFHPKTLKINFSYLFHVDRCLDVNQAWNYVQLLYILSKDSTQLFLDDRGIELPLSDIPKIQKLNIAKKYINLLKDMALIQSFFRVRLPNPLNKTLTERDIWGVRRLTEIMKYGKTVLPINQLTFSLSNEAFKVIEQSDYLNKFVPLSFISDNNFNFINILGVTHFPKLEIQIAKAKIISVGRVNETDVNLSVSVEEALLTIKKSE